MPKTVHKIELMDKLGRQFEPIIPRDAAGLHVGMQNGSLMLWYETSTAAPEAPSKFAVFGTGHNIPAHSRYIGSCQDGSFVWHVYERA